MIENVKKSGLVHTPNVNDSSQVQDNKNEKLPKYNYAGIYKRKLGFNKLPPLSASNQITKQELNKNISIFVYRNGDLISAPVKFLLYKSTLASMDAVLNEVSSKISFLNGAVLKLYKLDGELIESTEQLTNGAGYVAAHREKFKPYDYESISFHLPKIRRSQANKENKPELAVIEQTYESEEQESPKVEVEDAQKKNGLLPLRKVKSQEAEKKTKQLQISDSYRNYLMEYLSQSFAENKNNLEKKLKEKLELIQNINENIIGNDATFRTPFAKFTSENDALLITYCDYIASGKPLKFIEDYLRNEVLPTYANSHTTSSFTGSQTTRFREEARKLIGKYVNASEDDVVLFEGSGSTSAIQTLILTLNIREKIIKTSKEDEIPVVFVSPYEHHSNLLPWREIGAIVIQITEDIYGNINIEHLEEMLIKYNNKKRMLIGSFSAGSNVTGVLTDCDIVCQTCHKYGAWCFFDFAAAAPYVAIDMNPESSSLSYKDAIFISPHKLVGGPGSPGILVAKRHLFQNQVPHRPAGGTVFYVDSLGHSYTNMIEEKEEGGTPDIIGSIRCALAFKLKDQVGSEFICKLEEYFRDKAFTYWSKVPNLIILGPDFESIRKGQVNKMAFFSFLIKHKNSYLHFTFVSVLLNDLFGIQTRSGCSCAGPYGMEILGVTNSLTDQFKQAFGAASKIKETQISLSYLKYGWSRLNFNFFFDERTVEYVLKAVEFVATHGWKLLPLYKFDMATNEWNFRKLANKEQSNDGLKYLNDLNFFEKSKQQKLPKKTRFEYDNWLNQANRILEEAVKFMKSQLSINYEKDLEDFYGPDKYELNKNYGHLRWFLIPSEALAQLKGTKLSNNNKLEKPVFVPKSYPTSHEYVAKMVASENTTYWNSNN